MPITSLSAAQPNGEPAHLVSSAANDQSGAFDSQLDQAKSTVAGPDAARPATMTTATRPANSPIPAKREAEPKRQLTDEAFTAQLAALTSALTEAQNMPAPPPADLKQVAPAAPATTSAAPGAAAPVAGVNQDTAAPLSFAAKIQVAGATSSKEAADRLLNHAGAVASAWKKGQQHDAPHEETADQGPQTPIVETAKAGSDLSSLIGSAATPQASTAAPQQHSVTAAASRAVETPLPAQPAATTGQLKDISFRIPQADGSSVQLRLTQQSGELKVAVHTASADLSQGLRESLPDLTKKLSEGGFHAETWRPGVSAASAGAEAEGTRNQGGNPRGGDGQQQPGSGQQGRGQGQKGREEQPQWVEEFAKGMQSASSSTGALHGIGN